MIPEKFEYHRVASVSEAIDLMSQHGGDAQLLAGGHSLLPAMKLRLNAPAHLIDLGSVSELKGICMDGDMLCIGAGTTHHEIAESKYLADHAPIMAHTAASIGDIQVRNKGTLGGSVAHADPAADYPAALLASDADIVLQGKSGKRKIAAGDFFEGLFMTAMNDDEIITEVRISSISGSSGSCYMKFAQPASRFAIVGCAVVVEVSNGNFDSARVAFNGVSTSAFRDSAIEDALVGKPATAETIAAAAAHAAGSVDIMSDHFASEAYRKHLAAVMATRAITEAVSRT